MDPTALTILLATGLVSFLLGSFLRRLWRKRRHQKAQQLLLKMQELARQRQLEEPESTNKAKRRRQQRDRARHSGAQR